MALPATVALADECVVVNRSATGATHAAKSGNWFTITAAEGFAEFGVPEGEIADAVADWVALGYPETIAIFGRFTLAEGTGADEDGALTNGKGLEHFFDPDSPVLEDFLGVTLDHGGSLPPDF